ncbi:MAG TPA: amino acid racemase [Candidatus Acidoferrales bacterium]|nr:amino acid racemase [Candidatus Acidoferrales bacterium]
MTLTIGVLGGMGPEASVDFYRRITEHTVAPKDQDHLHVIIDSDPSVPDRSAFLLGRGPDPVPVLKAMARRLRAAGAELLVMACNTAHAFYADIATSVDVPLVDWVGEAARSVASRHAPGTAVGVLATTGTLGAGLYQKALSAYGLNVVVPGEEREEELMRVIYGPGGVKAGAGDRDVLVRRMREIAEDLNRNGASATLLACTELSALFPHRPDWSAPAYDAADLVAERVVTLAGGTVRPTS